MLSTTNVVLIYVVEDFYSRIRLGDIPMRDERKEGASMHFGVEPVFVSSGVPDGCFGLVFRSVRVPAL
jgi:hypothetical protein